MKSSQEWQDEEKKSHCNNGKDDIRGTRKSHHFFQKKIHDKMPPQSGFANLLATVATTLAPLPVPQGGGGGGGGLWQSAHADPQQLATEKSLSDVTGPKSMFVEFQAAHSSKVFQCALLRGYLSYIHDLKILGL